MSSSYTSVACAVQQDSSNINGLPGDNEFFALRERDNAEILSDDELKKLKVY